MRIDIVSDIVCPWCYVGKRHLDRALAQRPGLDFEIRWHPFELNPQIPDRGIDRETHWREKFGDASRLADMVGRLIETGFALDIEFDFQAIAIQPNTRRAHELLHAAGESGRADAVAEALFEAYFVHGQHIGDVATLEAIAKACGLDEAMIHDTLYNRQYELSVDEHLRQGRDAGVTSVPTFVIDGRHAFSGAQPPEFILKVIDHLAREPAAQGA